jgi:Fic family protein
LSAVRTEGDWEGWTTFFLECVCEAAADGVTVAQRLFARSSIDRKTLLKLQGATIPAIRLFDELPRHPLLTLSLAMKLLKTTKPTASKALDALRRARILYETTGKQRDRMYAYRRYLEILTGDTE